MHSAIYSSIDFIVLAHCSLCVHILLGVVKIYNIKIYISYGGNRDSFIRGKRCQLTVCPDTYTDTFESSALCRPMRSDIQFCAFRSTRCTMPSPVQATYRWALHLRALKCHRNLNDTWRIDLSAVNINIKNIYLVWEQNKRSQLTVPNGWLFMYPW